MSCQVQVCNSIQHEPELSFFRWCSDSLWHSREVVPDPLNLWVLLQVSFYGVKLNSLDVRCVKIFPPVTDEQDGVDYPFTSKGIDKWNR